MKNSTELECYDYGMCGVFDVIRIALVYRVLLLLRRPIVVEQPSVKLLIYNFTLHKIWVLHAGVAFYRRVKNRLSRK